MPDSASEQPSWGFAPRQVLGSVSRVLIWNLWRLARESAPLRSTEEIENETLDQVDRKACVWDRALWHNLTVIRAFGNYSKSTMLCHVQSAYLRQMHKLSKSGFVLPCLKSTPCAPGPLLPLCLPVPLSLRISSLQYPAKMPPPPGSLP